MNLENGGKWIATEKPECVEIPSLTEWYREQVNMYWANHSEWSRVDMEIPDFWTLVGFRLNMEKYTSDKKRALGFNKPPRDFRRNYVEARGYGFYEIKDVNDAPIPKKSKGE